jgi:allophanate hydrolase subunit 2
MLKTPKEFRPIAAKSWALRACYGAEIDLLSKESRFDLFDTNFSVGNRADRMGLQLEGARFEVTSGGRLASAPVFPGTIQCPEDGRPFLLSVDAQTIGGYPRVAHVARVDRHLIGQLRPGEGTSARNRLSGGSRSGSGYNLRCISGAFTRLATSGAD